MKITSFINKDLNGSQTHQQLKELGECVLVGDAKSVDNNDSYLTIRDNIFSSTSLKSVFERASSSDLVLLLTQNANIQLSKSYIDIINTTDKLFIYTDFTIEGIGESPLIDYQKGSLRDGFKFGPLLAFKKPKLMFDLIKGSDYKYGGLYDLVLKLSTIELPFHIATSSYITSPNNIDNRKSGEKQFDYLDVKNRDLQIEFEKVATEHLKQIGAYIQEKDLKEIDFSNNTFSIKASVIIPVFNREKTIADAVKSALNQKLDYPFNVIVVDNHSTDKTTEIVREIADKDERLIHIIPKEKDLKIGGCWNKALCSSHCGQFAIQLDSDDIYSDENTLKKIIATFHEQKCGMVIGSYKITNFKLETLPPGVIDHKEWTPDNGMNNALRINGLGAPRAFYTPLARQILFPNCSYGEDYAMGLAVSRQFKIGRIYDILYLCRRWEGNSDADLSIEKQNANDLAKDKMRTLEIEKRILLNNMI